MSRELLGDKVERALNSIGAPQIQQVMQKIGRKPCGCAGRKAALNRWHQRLLEEVEKIKTPKK